MSFSFYTQIAQKLTNFVVDLYINFSSVPVVDKCAPVQSKDGASLRVEESSGALAEVLRDGRPVSMDVGVCARPDLQVPQVCELPNKSLEGRSLEPLNEESSVKKNGDPEAGASAPVCVEKYKEPGAYEELMMRQLLNARFGQEVLREYFKNPHSIMLIGLIEHALNMTRRLSSGSYFDAFERIS